MRLVGDLVAIVFWLLFAAVMWRTVRAERRDRDVESLERAARCREALARIGERR